MNSILEKSPNPARALVFGLLASCFFTTNADCSDCLLKELRDSLSIDKKHEFVMGLSDMEIESILEKNKSCYEKRLSDLNQW